MIWLVIKLLIQLRKYENSVQTNSQKVTNEHDKEIRKERYISPEEKQNVIDDLRLT